MARCLATGSASINSSCCLIFFCGPRFFGAVAGVVSWPTSASSVVCSVPAITGSNDTGTRRRPFSNEFIACWEMPRRSASSTWVMPCALRWSAMRVPRAMKKARSSSEIALLHTHPGNVSFSGLGVYGHRGGYRNLYPSSDAQQSVLHKVNSYLATPDGLLRKLNYERWNDDVQSSANFDVEVYANDYVEPL